MRRSFMSDNFKEKFLQVFGIDESTMVILNDDNLAFIKLLIQKGLEETFITEKEIVESCESMNLRALYLKAKKRLLLIELYQELCQKNIINENGSLTR